MSSNQPEAVNLEIPSEARAADFDWIEHRLRDSLLPGLLLHGVPGIGKTTLLQEVVSQQEIAGWPVVSLDLRTFSRRTTEDLLRRCLNQLFPQAPDADPLVELSRRLVTTPALLAFDHLETLSEYEQVALARFISYLPRTRAHVLLASDVPLTKLAAERTVAVRLVDVGFNLSEARAFLLGVARSPENSVVAAIANAESGRDRDLMMSFQRCFEGHPLTMRLAAGIALSGPRALPFLLATTPEAQPERTTATIASAVKALGPDAQKAFPLLRFFPTGYVSEEALRAVCMAVVEAEQNGDELTSNNSGSANVAWCLQGPQQLVQRGLLVPSTTTGFWVCHPLVTQEASRQTLTSRSGGHIALRLLMVYRSLAERHLGDAAKLQLITDAATLLMEGFWSQRSKPSPVDRLMLSLIATFDDFWQSQGRRGLRQLWQQRAEVMIQNEQPAESQPQPAASKQPAEDESRSRTVDQKPESAQSSTSENRDQPASAADGDLTRIVQRFNEVLQEWTSLSDADRARRWAQLALQQVDAESLALLWLAHSVTCFQSGDGANCDAALKQANHIAVEAGRRDIAALTASLAAQRSGMQASIGAIQQHLNPGLESLQRGNGSEALPHLERALVIARQSQQPLTMASCLFYIGRAQYLCDNTPEALKVLIEAQEFATAAHEPTLFNDIEKLLAQVRRHS